MEPASNPARNGLRAAIACVLLFCGTVLLFLPATRFGFINYDDPTYVTQNPHVRAGLSWAGFAWAFTGLTDYWHPLTWLAHMLDWQLYGSAPAGHHLTSIAWHALNAALAFLVFKRLAGGFWRSLSAAALFAWHPLRVESVVWIAERKDVLSGFFFFLTLLAYAAYVQARRAGATARQSGAAPSAQGGSRRSKGRKPGPRDEGGPLSPELRDREPASALDSPPSTPGRGSSASSRYLLALACFAAGLMSKSMLVTTPLILLLLDVWPFARCSSAKSIRDILVEKVPFLALSAAAGIATLFTQRRTGAFVLHLPFGARAENALVSLARYLGKFAWPFDLVVCYRHPGYWPAAAVLGAAMLAVGLGWLAWNQRRTRPWIAVGLGWFVIMLLPVLGLIQVGFQSIADRYTYLPLLGVELAILWSLPEPDTHAAGIITATSVAAVLSGCAWRTLGQEQVWRNSVSLFQHAVSVSSRNDVAEDFLSSALFAANRIDEAGVHAELACSLNPRNFTARVMLAGIRQRQGRISAAIELYRESLALRPDDAEVACQLGELELATGHPDEARRRMLPALASAPPLRERAVEIGKIALQHHDLASARFLFELVAATDPRNADAHVGLGTVLMLSGDRTGGIAQWRRALELNPSYPGLRDQIAALESTPGAAERRNGTE